MKLPFCLSLVIIENGLQNNMSPKKLHFYVCLEMNEFMLENILVYKFHFYVNWNELMLETLLS